MKSIQCVVFLMLLSLNCASVKADKNFVKLWYDKPADEWMKSVPIGNGRLGAMVYGGVTDETIALNESSMWAGEYDDNPEIPFGKEKLQELRSLFFEGKLIEGNKIAARQLRGVPNSFGTHLPIGDLKLKFTYPKGDVKAYQRSLTLNNALAEVSYQVGDIQYKREYFSTNPDDVIVVRMTANRKRSINTTLSLEMLRTATVRTEGRQLIFDGQATFPKQGKGGVHFQGRISVNAPNAKLKLDSTQLSVQGADELILIIDVRTDYRDNSYKERCAESIKKAASKPYKSLKSTHIKDFTPLFDRVSLTLGNSTYDNLPTDQRWKQVKSGASDPGLDALFFQYGRYLLLASSRENSPLPVALQGFFNDNLACNMCWTSDYHLDINTQQNYWIANVGNLAECNAPLFSYIKDLSIHGAKTARNVYGCKGWTAHTTSNIWGFTSPSPGIGFGLFPTASSWMASHLWTEYEYTLDKNFLQEVAYPLLKGNAEFLLDYMTVDPNTGHLVTGPSISPENAFRYQGKSLCASMMPTCDRVLAYEIFNACIQSSDLLGKDRAFSDTLKQALSKFPPIRLGANGAIREWYEDYEEAVPNHRHTTHLLALYPFSQISLANTPELAVGARKTIEGRLAAKNWEDTEWSRANMICFYARLKDAEKAYQSVHILEKSFTRENLLTISPAGIAGAPSDIFIFDGNAAGAAGIAEMLIQNHEGYVEFLPCLPKQWEQGEYNGLCIRGGAEVSARWSKSVIEKASMKATVDNLFRIKIPQGKKYAITINKKGIKAAPDSKGIVTVNMKKNDILEIK